MKNKKDAVVAIMLFNMANDEAEKIIEKEIDRSYEKCDQKFIDDMIDLVDTVDALLAQIETKVAQEKAEE